MILQTPYTRIQTHIYTHDTHIKNMYRFLRRDYRLKETARFTITMIIVNSCIIGSVVATYLGR